MLSESRLRFYRLPQGDVTDIIADENDRVHIGLGEAVRCASLGRAGGDRGGSGPVRD
jgi:hypothetical protein